MFEDFSFCTECNYYDSTERRCNLFNRKIKVCGCQYGADRKPSNNYERLKAMSMEELARFIARQRGRYCNYKDPEDDEYPKALEWLKEEVHDS